MDNKEIFEKVKAIIAEKLAVDEDSITENSSFVNDLKADSMDILDLVSGFEEEFDITIPDEKGRTFETVKEVVAYLATLIK
ncbi:MAG: acyl carrier protein [Sphaerochaetaceae bacterium]|nr:acyl carrier protein [Sphaerochaetaceae bacterium]